jgi:hypothetical protein
MDHKGPEHHYDEIECPGCGSFFQQGEIQPETVHNSCPDCGYDLRSGTGGRPYRGQPSPVNSEMTERNTPLDGASGDRGGNPLGEGILAGLKDKMNWEEIAELDEATEPAGLGETHPVKDNQWKPGDRSDRANGRDEMLGSVRKSNEDWDQIIEDFEQASERAKEVNDLERVAVASWLEHTGAEEFPIDHLGWDIVDVVEPSKEFTEASNKYSMPLPKGITDNLHEALIKTNAWVENPEENGKLRPYKEYWSVIRPKTSQGSIQIGVEDPHMADIINDVARTDNLSALSKASNTKNSAFLAALPELAAGLAAGTVGLGDVAGVAGPALAGHALMSGVEDVANEALGDPGQIPNMPMQDAAAGGPGSGVTSSHIATYGDEYEHPSSITRRIEDPVNGGIDPHQRTDESNDDWAYDMLDVNEMGQSKDPKGADDVKERHKRMFTTNEDKKTEKNLADSESIQKFLNFLPLVMEFFNSPEPGAEDPIMQSIHEGLNAEFPGYLGEAVPEEENQILLFFGDEPKKGDKKSNAFGPSSLVTDTPASSQMSLGQEHPTTMNKCHNCGAVLDASDKICPKCSAANAMGDSAESGSSPAWPYGTAQNLVQPYMGKVRTASDQQGPHTDAQQAAVADLLIEQGREDEVGNMLEKPYEYHEELAIVQKKDPLLGEDPEDQPMPPMEQPVQNQGMPPGIPPMQAPTPGDLGGGMPSPIASSMLKAAFKYGSDNVAGTCPKCDSHTTKMVQQDGVSKCHTCKHQWQDETFEKADGDSSNASTTASFYQSLNIDELGSPEPVSHIDSFSEPEEEIEIDDSSHTWKDEDGDDIQEGKEYEIYANDYDIPDVGRVNEVKPDAISYTIDSDGGLQTTIEIDRKEADLNGYRFVPANEVSESNPHGIEQNMDSKPVPVPGESTDLSTPHREIGASAKMSNYEQLIQEARNWLLELDGPAVFREFEGLDWEDYADEINALSPDQVHQAIDTHYGGGWNEFISNLQPGPPPSGPIIGKTAGKHYTPMEQRELIDEYGQARNADKLDLEGTHYIESSLDDSFLFGC